MNAILGAWDQILKNHQTRFFQSLSGPAPRVDLHQSITKSSGPRFFFPPNLPNVKKGTCFLWNSLEMIQNTYCKFHVSGKRKCSFRLRGTSLRRHTSVQLTHLEAGTEKMSTSLSCGENKTASPNVLKKYEEMIVMAVAMLTADLHSPENRLCTGTFFSIMMSHVCFCMVWICLDAPRPHLTWECWDAFPMQTEPLPSAQILSKNHCNDAESDSMCQLQPKFVSNGRWPHVTLEDFASVTVTIIWRFPEIGVPHFIIHCFSGFPIINHPFWVLPWLWKSHETLKQRDRWSKTTCHSHT